jgi:Peptidase family M23
MEATGMDRRGGVARGALGAVLAVVAVGLCCWLAPAPAAIAADQLTPIGMRVVAAPVPVEGSDDAFHVVYEIEVTNFTPKAVTLDALDVLDPDHGKVAASLDAPAIAARLVVSDPQAKPGTLGAAQAGLLYMHLTFPTRPALPRLIEHRLSATLGGQPVTETAARSTVSAPTSLVVAPPLRGERYMAGDGCCDSVRHIRATLPVNGQRVGAQRFAIDWEQLDPQERIYVGDPKQPASYVIYGKPIYAVADGVVVAAVDGLPDSPPGLLPAGLAFEQADGNHVVQSLGNGRFALYAHMQPRSVKVHAGQHVRAGTLLGLVGTSGNSSEPHLHFQVTDGPSPMAANGVPYLLRRFSATERGVSTEAYDRASADGQPLAREPVGGAPVRLRKMPMDLWIVQFAP